MTTITERKEELADSDAELLRKLQIQTEGGAILCSEYVGGYMLLEQMIAVIRQHDATQAYDNN